MITDRFPIGIGSILVIIMALAGAVVLIVDPAALSFGQYFTYMTASGAVTAVAHGLDNGTGNAP